MLEIIQYHRHTYVARYVFLRLEILHLWENDSFVCCIINYFRQTYSNYSKIRKYIFILVYLLLNIYSADIIKSKNKMFNLYNSFLIMIIIVNL